MTKKVFLQKGSKGKKEGGARSHFKILLWGALAFILLVVLTPLVTRDRGSHDVSRKPEAEKGVVVREIPRALQLMQEDSLGRSDVPADMFRAQEDPSAFSFLDGREEAAEEERVLSTDARESMERLQSLEKGAEAPARTAPTGDSERRQALPDSSTPALSPDAVKPERHELPKQAALQRPSPAQPPPTRQDAPAERFRPSPPRGSMVYGVQVGSFREQKNALALKKRLESKGYQVLVKPMNHETLGLLHVVQLKPVSDLSRASTLVEQIKMEENVTPFVVRIPVQ